MTIAALSGTGTVLAIIGLVVGLVVAGVVVWLLNDVLAPLRRISTDVQFAATAPMLKRGIPGADQLTTTRRLAESVPALALAYLGKLGLSGRPAPTPFAPPPPPPPPPPASAPAAAPPGEPEQPSSLPAWKLFQQRGQS